MDPQMLSQYPPQYQNQYPTQLPTQQMNSSQQRQIPTGQQQQQQHQQQQLLQQQQTQVPVQPKSTQVVQHYQNPYANYDPQLVLFSLERPKTAKTWEDVDPEQQHVSVQDLQNELSKFRRNKGSVKRVMNEITSTSCRRRINELVEEQNNELWKCNRSLQYRIASVEVEWRSINRRERMLKRVQVILDTEPSGFQEPTLIKSSSVPMNNPYPPAPQEPIKPVKQQSIPQSQQYQVQNLSHTQFMGQLPRTVPQPQPHPLGQIQHHEQQPMRVPPPPHLTQMQHFENQPLRVPPPISTQNHTTVIPPPPPPGTGQTMGQLGAAVPPPPPPSSTEFPSLQSFKPKGVMPGTFPEPIAVPVDGMNSSYGKMGSMFLKNKKSKHHKGQYDSSSSSSSDSESDSSGSESSSSDDDDKNIVRVLPNNHTEYSLTSQRQRGRDRSQHSSKSRKSQRLRSQSKPRSAMTTTTRSRSQSRIRQGNKLVETYNNREKMTSSSSSRRQQQQRRNSESYVDGRQSSMNGKYTPVSSQHSSPRSSRPEIPPIHIHMNTNTNTSSNTDDLRDRQHGTSDRSMTSSSLPGSYYKAKRITSSHHDIGEPMSREGSWDRGSGTASYGTASTGYTAEDMIFDAPVRRVSVSHSSQGHGRTKSYSQPQQHGWTQQQQQVRASHLYDADVEEEQRFQSTRRPLIKHSLTETNYTPSTRPLPHRRNSVQVPSTSITPTSPTGNPFTSHFPSHPTRAMSYTSDHLHPTEANYSFPPRRSIADHPAAEEEERVDLRELADAIEHIKESRRVPMMKRRGTGEGMAMRNSVPVFTGDEWDVRYQHQHPGMQVQGMGRRSGYAEYGY